jgi:hypothetical protein
MFKFIDDITDDVLAIETIGKVSHEDYKDKLIPAADKIIKEYGKLKALYVIGDDFDGFELGALWDDTMFGVQHWSDVSHIAIVTDHQWVQSMSAFFAPFFPGIVRVFALNRLEEAKAWVSQAQPQEMAS